MSRFSFSRRDREWEDQEWQEDAAFPAARKARSAPRDPFPWKQLLWLPALIPVVIGFTWLIRPPDGPYVEHYRTGQIAVRGRYEGGRKAGLWIHYWANGNRQLEGRYVEGKREGVWKYYTQNGLGVCQGVFRQGRMWEGEFAAYVLGKRVISRIHEGKKDWGGKIPVAAKMPEP